MRPTGITLLLSQGYYILNQRSSLVTRTLVYSAEDQWFETHLKIKVSDSRSLRNHQRMRTLWRHRGNKGNEERNCLLYLSKLMAQDKCPFEEALPNVRIVHGAYFFTLYWNRRKSPDTTTPDESESPSNTDDTLIDTSIP